MMSDLIHVATITSAFGIKGQVKAHLFLSDPSLIQPGMVFSSTRKNLTLSSISLVKPDFAHVGFKEVTTRTEAEALKNEKLFAPLELLPSLEQDEFYLHDLKEFKVITTDNTDVFGTVIDLVDYGAGNILEISYEDQTLMVPFVSEIVPDIDPIKKQIVVESAYIKSMLAPVSREETE
ncbi:MAG TPA: ribosome maturation factor RimM [Alphaproteobacteria bacterium]|nr:ribosome maturation factor RimM [Alphaproteobacteria bacterium]